MNPRHPDAIYRGERSTGPAGEVVTHVTINGRPLELPQLGHRNPNNSGFEWGYPGAGAAQLALALVLDVTGGDVVRAKRSANWIKWSLVVAFGDRWSMSSRTLRKWLDQLDRPAADGDVGDDADQPATVTAAEGGAA